MQRVFVGFLMRQCACDILQHWTTHLAPEGEMSSSNQISDLATLPELKCLMIRSFNVIAACLIPCSKVSTVIAQCALYVPGLDTVKRWSGCMESFAHFSVNMVEFDTWSDDISTSRASFKHLLKSSRSLHCKVHKFSEQAP